MGGPYSSRKQEKETGKHFKFIPWKHNKSTAVDALKRLKTPAQGLNDSVLATLDHQNRNKIKHECQDSSVIEGKKNLHRNDFPLKNF